MELHRRIEALYSRVEQHGAYFRGVMRVDSALPKSHGKTPGVRVDPIVCALAIKAATTKQAIVALCEGGDGDNAFALTRVLMENAILLEWLIRDRRRLDVYALFTSVVHERTVAIDQRFRPRFSAAESTLHSDPYHLAITTDVFGNPRPGDERPTRDLDHDGTLKPVSIKKMFEAITGTADSYEYLVFYGALGSDIVHSGPFSLASTVTILEPKSRFLLRPIANPDKCSIALAMSNAAMFLVLDSLNEFVGLGLSEDLAVLKAEYQKDPSAVDTGTSTESNVGAKAVTNIKKQWIDVPLKVLGDNKQDAVIVLRLGAFANAVQGVLVRFLACLHHEEDSTGAERDRMMLFLVGAGYMKEAVDHIQKHQARLRQLLNLARKSGYPLSAKWTEMEDLLTTKAGSVYDRVLKRVRHDLAFHFSEDVFARWIDKSGKDFVRLWDLDGTKNSDRLYRASSDALAFDLVEGKEVTEPSVRDAFDAVRDAQLMLFPVVEAALVGFIVACGLEPDKYHHYEEAEES